MSSVPQIMALPVSPFIVTQSLLMCMLNFVSLQEILRNGGNSVTTFNRSKFKEPLLPAFVPGVSNNRGYSKGDLYWWPPAASKERPPTSSPNFTQNRFEAFDPKVHSKVPTIKFEEDAEVPPIKSTETTTAISQNSDIIGKEGGY